MPSRTGFVNAARRMVQALPVQVLLESGADVFASSRVARHDLPQPQEEVAGIPRLLLVERRNSSAWGRWPEPH